MGNPGRAAARSGPERPDHRSAARYLVWLTRCQLRRVAVGATFGTLWLTGLMMPPYLLSRAVDDGLVPGHRGALLGWTAALLAMGALNAALAIARHRTMTRVRMDATFRTVRAVVDQTLRLGASLPRRVTAGEVITIGIGDVGVISQTLTLTGPGVGAVLSYGVVAALLLAVDPALAALVLLGVPALAVLVGPLLRRLEGAEARYRERQGGLTDRLADLVGGVRVLGGLGGKEVFAARYRRESAELCAEGYRVGAHASWIQALGVGLPALFLAAVVWLAARMAAAGTISVGELVAVYGYTAALAAPVSFLIEAGYDVTRGLVAARRVVRFLGLEPDARGGGEDGPALPSVLRDPVSGVEVVPGTLTALAGARPEESAAVVDRLGGVADSAATWGAVRLDAVDTARLRERILVADNEAALFAGTVYEAVSGRRPRPADAVARALHTAVAQDIVQALPGGLDARLDADGRNLSGGQRQRLRLVRALLADPEVLLAVEPTSAVDAHTEAAIAARLHAARAGRTTVVATTSPLVLDAADVVCHLSGGRVAAVGTHRDLLAAHPEYRALVARGAEDPEDGTEEGATEEGAEDRTEDAPGSGTAAGPGAAAPAAPAPEVPVHRGPLDEVPGQTAPVAEEAP
ncbi:ABC transporter transmembrane domain-containing protein [Streptomyces catenulae]|uniref:ABC transporter ATP-binding protein n=1 Tax=Streptomyces catenulae TaxID=66875 RepID=A0ABV2YV32_9ACTN|nr:ABC transporter ATP-binding protein [Streptomyces catenulae]